MFEKILNYLSSKGSQGPEKLIEKLAKNNDSVLITDGFAPNTFDIEVTKNGNTEHGKMLSVKGKWEIKKL